MYIYIFICVYIYMYLFLYICTGACVQSPALNGIVEYFTFVSSTLNPQPSTPNPNFLNPQPHTQNPAEEEEGGFVKSSGVFRRGPSIGAGGNTLREPPTLFTHTISCSFGRCFRAQSRDCLSVSYGVVISPYFPTPFFC